MNDDVRPFPGDNDHEGARTNHPPDADDAPASTSPLDEIVSGLKVWADVGITLGTKMDEQSKSYDRFMARLQRNTPVDYGGAAAGVFPASGVLLLNFGTPDQGTRWEVTAVAVGGVDFDTAVAGKAGLFVSSQLPIGPTGRAPAGTTALADLANALPNVAFYGTRQLVVNDQEYLFLIVSGGTAGTTYAANFSATVFPSDAAGGKDVVTL